MSDDYVITGTTDTVHEDIDLVGGGLLKISNGTGAFLAYQEASAYGTFSVQSDGNWTYTLNNASSLTQGLGGSETVQDRFLVSWYGDGQASASVFVDVTIQGRNDLASVSGDTAVTLVATNQSSASGVLIIADVDSSEKTFVMRSSVAGQLGDFSLNVDGSWSYSLHSGVAAPSQPVDDVFQVQTLDGVTSSVKITVTNSGSNDALSGTSGDDVIDGLGGNDTINGSTGNDTIDGGTGTDVAVFSGGLSTYTVTHTGSTYSVCAKTGSDGTDTVTNVESLQFADMTVNLTVQATAATMATTDLGKLEELYIAFFNRVPDADGLAYWISQFKAGSNINQIAESFYSAGVQNSSTTGFSSTMSHADFVNVIYRNVLGRTTGADSDGLAYWSGKLADGTATHGSLVSAVLDSAHTFKGDAAYGYVADLLDNKIAVANQFAVDWGLNYNATSDSITQGMAIAAAVTATSTAPALALVGISAADMGLG